MNGRNVLLTATWAILLMAPLVASAQIVPCDGVDVDCDWGKLIQLGQNILNFIVTISVIVAALMFAYVGWLFFSDSGNAQNIEKGKKVFGAVMIGLVLVLTAWLIIDTILETLTDTGLEERSRGVSIHMPHRTT